MKKAGLDPLDLLIKKGGRKKGKKGRKIGRGKRHLSSLRYTREERWRSNKKRRMGRHMRHFPLDLQAARLFALLLTPRGAGILR